MAYPIERKESGGRVDAGLLLGGRRRVKVRAQARRKRVWLFSCVCMGVVRG